MRYILHYTDPGDIVLDGFCGTGMTGVAAQLCGDRRAVQSLGYRVQDDGTVLDEKGRPFSRLGPRRAVLIDLCPAATFIAYNYNTPVDPDAFEREARRILREVEEECGWMYETWHPHCDAPDRVQARINYTVWSDLFLCPHCGQEIVFWDVAVDRASGRVREEFPCPRCGALHTKRTLDRAWETVYDRALKAPVRRARQVPVLIHYTVGRRRYEKTPDAADLDLLRRIEETDIPYPFPTDRMPEGDESRRPDERGHHPRPPLLHPAEPVDAGGDAEEGTRKLSVPLEGNLSSIRSNIDLKVDPLQLGQQRQWPCVGHTVCRFFDCRRKSFGKSQAKGLRYNHIPENDQSTFRKCFY